MRTCSSTPRSPPLLPALAASTHNSIGVAGVGFDSGLLNGKVSGDADGRGSISVLIDGINWAANQGAT